MAGKSVRLFFVDGTATGIVTAEIMNWTGHVLVAPRSRLGEAMTREEASSTGIYFLVGEDPDRPNRTMIYIGEGDSVSARLRAHARDETKDFWSRACLVTSKDANLTKAHVRYLEHELVRLARQADRATVTNGNDPKSKLLPEADQADMAFFIAQVETILPALGLDFLRPKRPSITRQTSSTNMPHPDDDTIHLTMTHRSGVAATAIERDGEIIVLMGSQVQNRNYASSKNHKALREQLIDDGTIVATDDEDKMVFAKDYAFNSPSTAAGVIINRNTNGRTNWKLPSGESLAEWQDRQLG